MVDGVEFNQSARSLGPHGIDTGVPILLGTNKNEVCRGYGSQYESMVANKNEVYIHGSQ